MKVVWDVMLGTQRCERCDSYLISLVLTDESGRVVYFEYPLLCPMCDANQRTRKYLGRIRRHVGSLNLAFELLDKVSLMRMYSRYPYTTFF